MREFVKSFLKVQVNYIVCGSRVPVTANVVKENFGLVGQDRFLFFFLRKEDKQKTRKKKEKEEEGWKTRRKVSKWKEDK